MNRMEIVVEYDAESEEYIASLFLRNEEGDYGDMLDAVSHFDPAQALMELGQRSRSEFATLLKGA